MADGTNPSGDIEFTVGEGRTCTEVTIVSTLIATGDRNVTINTFMGTDTHEEVRCLVDGEHEYNHTVTTEHSVEVVGYAESGIHVHTEAFVHFAVRSDSL